MEMEFNIKILLHNCEQNKRMPFLKKKTIVFNTNDGKNNRSIVEIK